MVLWKFKSCPRCGGDIFIDKESQGWYEQCLQCGHLRNILGTIKVDQPGGEEEKEKALTQPRK